MQVNASRLAGCTVVPPTTPIYSHNRITFNGTQELTLSSDLEAVTTGIFTMAFNFIVPNLSSRRDIMGITDGIGPHTLFGIAADGSIKLGLPTAVGVGGFFGEATTAAGVVTAGTEYTAVVTAFGGTQEVTLWLNGNAVSVTTPLWAASSIATTDVSGFTIGNGSFGTFPFVGSIGFLWVDGLTYLFSPNGFYLPQYAFPLGASGDKPTGTRPGIYFGCDQSLASWQAGTNRGDLGNFSVSGTLA